MASITKRLLTSPLLKNHINRNAAFIRCNLDASMSMYDVDRTNENGYRCYGTTRSPANIQEVGNDTTVKILPGSEIPSILTLPIVGNLFSMLVHKDFDKNRIYKLLYAMHRELGPIFKLAHPGTPTVVFLANPEDVKKLISETEPNPIRSGFHALKHIRDHADDNYFQKKAGILHENNCEWKRVRSKVQTPIMKIQNVERYLGTMDEVSLDFIERIKELRNSRQEVPDNFLTELYKWGLESVATVALNRRIGCLSKGLQADSYQMKLIEAVSGLFIYMQDIDHFPVWKWYPTRKYTNMKKCHDYIVKIAEENVRAAEESLMLKDKSKEKLTVLETYLLTKELTRTDVTTFMADLFIAGIDTTSNTVAFTLYLLSRNPEKQKVLQSHLDKILGDGKSPITTNQLAAMSYLKYCVKETLRFYPIAFGIVRILEKDVVINKYLIPKGWNGVAVMGLLGSSESEYSEPDRFIPERWQRSRPHGIINPYTALPFSHGKRSCIGRRISQQEMYTVLARICHQFNIEYHYDDLDPYQHLILTPDKPLKFKFTDRK